MKYYYLLKGTPKGDSVAYYTPSKRDLFRQISYCLENGLVIYAATKVDHTEISL